MVQNQHDSAFSCIPIPESLLCLQSLCDLHSKDASIISFGRQIFFYLLMSRESDIVLLFHLFMHSWVASCMCPDGDRTCSLGVLGRCSNQLRYYIRLGVQILFLFLKYVLLLISERESNRSAVSCMPPPGGSSPHPGHAPQLGIEPWPLHAWRDTQPSEPHRARAYFFKRDFSPDPHPTLLD